MLTIGLKNQTVNGMDVGHTGSDPPVRSLGLVEAQKSSTESILASPVGQNIAWLDALGLKPEDIEKQLDLHPYTVYSIRANPVYQSMLKACLKMKASLQIAAYEGDIEGLFNDQIGPSVATLIEIRDNPTARETARLRAAEQFLDRASKAPKVKTEVNEHRTVITLPISEMQNMQRALLEAGGEDALETAALVDLRERQEDGVFEVPEGVRQGGDEG